VNKRKNHNLAAEWTTEDIEVLINTLYDIRLTHGTDKNSSSFKPQAWRIVADALEKVHTKGGPKNARSNTVTDSSRSSLKPADDSKMSLVSGGVHTTDARRKI